MKKGLIKGLIVLTIVTSVVGLSGCNRDPKPTVAPTTPPTTTEEQEQNVVNLLAPTISVGENMVLSITPSTDAGTVEKTTGYEVSINGNVQFLDKTELSLQLEIGAGDDVIEVKSIGGENTESKEVSTITVTEEQKAHIAYNQAMETLNVVLQNKLAEITGTSGPLENYELVNVYKNGDNLEAVVRYDRNGYTFQRALTMQNIAENYNDIFDLHRIVNQNDISTTFKQFSTIFNYYGNQATNAILSSNYIDQSAQLIQHINNSWTATVIDENMGAIDTISGNYEGIEGIHRFTTTATIKLEKEGEETKFINTSYRVNVARTYDKNNLVELLANGAIAPEDIIVENEVFTELDNANIYYDAKEQFEGQQVQMNQSSTIEQLSFKSSNGNSYTITLPSDPEFGM